jgi:acetyltransferase
MKGGTPVTIRPIRPEDEGAMVHFHETLSDHTVYLRYFCSLSLARRTAHERLARICIQDQKHGTVLIADFEQPQTREHRIFGVGRLSKLPVDKVAEIAVLISDQHQQQGLGTELLRRLIEVARDEGLSRLVAEMLRENLAVQKTFRRLGFSLAAQDDPTVVRAILEL